MEHPVEKGKDPGMNHVSGADAVQANLIRQANLDRLRLAMRELRTATRPQLARQTGLSVVTVNALADVLAASGEIIDADDPALATGGRPALRYRYNAHFQLALAIHTGEAVHTGEADRQDAIHAEVVDLLGDVVDRQEATLDDISAEALEHMIAEMLTRHPAIRAIGIGLPGLEVGGSLDVDYRALAGKELVTRLKERFRMPVAFENDANAAVLGFCTGSACQGRTIVGIYVPEKYPPGAGICIDGHIYRGRDGFAGEVKHLPGANVPGQATPLANLAAILASLAITFTCVLNPDTIVLYRNNLSRQTLEAVLKKCRQVIPAGFLPEIVASDGFQADFSKGIRAIALQALEQQTKGSV